nr:HprK-related kinase A [Halorhodospira halophila]
MGYSSVVDRLSSGELAVQTGPFRFALRSRLASVAQGIWQLYADHPVLESEHGCDFHCEVVSGRGVRRYYRPQALFYADAKRIFKPLPRNQAFPMLEWGLNWCVGMQTKHFLLFHAACLEKNGRAVILPAPPEAGKSTLCAALANRGWRLLSDEVAAVELAGPQPLLYGLARPVSLKNASIEVIQRFAPEAVISTPCCDTRKGSVAHMRPPAASVARASEPTPPGWVVFPRYRPYGPVSWRERSPADTLMGLIAQSFNYAALGRRAFHRTVDLVEQAPGYDFGYSRLEEAVESFDALAA